MSGFTALSEALVSCSLEHINHAAAHGFGIPMLVFIGFDKGYADYDDGLPIVFSWPVASETVDVTDFKFTLNTGEVVFPHAAGMVPNPT